MGFSGSRMQLRGQTTRSSWRSRSGSLSERKKPSVQNEERTAFVNKQCACCGLVGEAQENDPFVSCLKCRKPASRRKSKRGKVRKRLSFDAALAEIVERRFGKRLRKKRGQDNDP